jgi:hypothetical protein
VNETVINEYGAPNQGVTDAGFKPGADTGFQNADYQDNGGNSDFGDANFGNDDFGGGDSGEDFGDDDDSGGGGDFA